MAKFSYEDIKAKLESGSEMNISPTDESGVGQELGGQTGTLTGTVTIEVPQLPTIEFPMEDLTFDSDIRGQKQDLWGLLGINKWGGKSGHANGYAGSQILLNSDRIVLNSRTDYLMLFAQQGVAIASKGDVHIDADDAVTIYGEDGLFLGVPGKGKGIDQGGGNQKEPKTKADATKDNDYEPLVLGTKLANLMEDLLVILKNATLLTPVGKGYFREDVMYEFACLQARIPEMLSSWGYVDGISHEPVDKAPEPPKTVTEPPTTLTGAVTGTFVTDPAMDPNAPSDVITNSLADQPGFYESVQLY